MDIHTSVRISYKNESELHRFVKDKGGIKKAINYLFDYYNVNKDNDQLVNEIVSKLKNQIDFTPIQSTTTTTVKKKATTTNDDFVIDAEADDFLNNFLGG